MKGLASVLLAFADDELVIGHRHSEWTGWAPHIEEDIAFSSIAQDEIGHASMFYNLLSQLDGRSADEIAFGRQAGDFRHAKICEMPNGDWAFTIARHFLYNAAEKIRLEDLSQSSHQPLADVCTKILREERYHEMHATAWIVRLSEASESKERISEAVRLALAAAPGLFEPYENEDEALSAGIIKQSSASLMTNWQAEVLQHAEKYELSGELPVSQDSFGGRIGLHGEDFTTLWQDLTMTFAESPGAKW